MSCPKPPNAACIPIQVEVPLKMRGKNKNEILNNGTLKEGDEVRVRFHSRKRFYPARIERDNGDGTYDVIYYDGAPERRVPREMIGRELVKPGDRLVLNGTEYEVLGKSKNGKHRGRFCAYGGGWVWARCITRTTITDTQTNERVRTNIHCDAQTRAHQPTPPQSRLVEC